MTEYNWAEVRARAVALFRDVPHDETEQVVREVFKRSPRLVVDAVEHVGEQVQRGTVHNGWAVLRVHLGRAESSTELVVTDESERERRIAQAEGWVRNAGRLFDCEAEVEDELFGERGRLRAWADDPVREHLLTLWREQRPTGEQIEREELARTENYRRRIRGTRS